MDISDDGKVVGRSGNPFWSTPRAFIWTIEDGMMYLGDYLDQQGVEYPEGTHFYQCSGISADGMTITGAILPPGGFFSEPFVVYLGTVVSNGDTQPQDNDTPAFSTKLTGAYPNPFNPMATVKFSVERDQLVKLSVYDVNGRHVVDLASRVFTAGDHSLVWQGKDAQGLSVASGTYLLKMETEKQLLTSKMMLVR